MKSTTIVKIVYAENNIISVPIKHVLYNLDPSSPDQAAFSAAVNQ